MSKLLTPKIINQIPNLYETEDKDDQIAQVKLFTPDSNFTWYILELCKENLDVCYGFTVGFEAEYGYFSLEEIEALRGPMGLMVERDMWFEPLPMSEIKKQISQRMAI
jgi:hypothetical protein